MILTSQQIRARGIITPFCERTMHEQSRTTYGVGPAGYDVRIAETIRFERLGFFRRLLAMFLRRSSERFALASTMEHFEMPDDVIAVVHDKSTWARRGLAVQNTIAEPGWRGYLTLEITHHRHSEMLVPAGSGIAQILFHQIAEPAERPYDGRYQDQEAGPQEAR